jgi:hypothetical protein
VEINKEVRQMNVLFSFVLPLAVITFFAYWTMKISYSNRFIPSIVLALLAVIMTIVPPLAASSSENEWGFGAAIAGVYYSMFFGVGVLVSLIFAIFIKKE